MKARRLDTQILRATEVGQIYTVGALSETLRRNHHEVVGAMSRLKMSGYFEVLTIGNSFEYLRQEGGQ